MNFHEIYSKYSKHNTYTCAYIKTSLVNRLFYQTLAIHCLGSLLFLSWNCQTRLSQKKKVKLWHEQCICAVEKKKNINQKSNAVKRKINKNANKTYTQHTVNANRSRINHVRSLMYDCWIFKHFDEHIPYTHTHMNAATLNDIESVNLHRNTHAHTHTRKCTPTYTKSVLSIPNIAPENVKEPPSLFIFSLMLSINFHCSGRSALTVSHSVSVFVYGSCRKWNTLNMINSK